jgi:hypothetical protein
MVSPAIDYFKKNTQVYKSSAWVATEMKFIYCTGRDLGARSSGI